MKSLKYLGFLLLIIPLMFSCSNNTTEVSTVATPTFSVAGGTYTSAQPLEISCTTDGAIIKYTTDGTGPDTSVTAITYSTAITVSHDQTIKAVAIKDGWDNSTIVSATFVIYNQMSHVASGTFTMGRTKASGLTEYDDELPTHAVTLTKSFYISKFEVQQTEWLAVMGSNPSEFSSDTSRPVEMVSWYAVLVYCNKRSMNEGLTPAYSIGGHTDPVTWGVIPTTNNVTWNGAICNWNANGYRLPSEAEWEFAARGGVSTPDFIFSGSDDVGTVSWYDGNAGTSTHSVGQKQANGLGLYDMSGNVQEWVWDWYSNSYYTSGAVTDPTGPTSGTIHTIRGGSWDTPASWSRIVFRNYGTPEKEAPKVINNRLGFRVVRTAQ